MGRLVWLLHPNPLTCPSFLGFMVLSNPCIFSQETEKFFYAPTPPPPAYWNTTHPSRSSLQELSPSSSCHFWQSFGCLICAFFETRHKLLFFLHEYTISLPAGGRELIFREHLAAEDGARRWDVSSYGIWTHFSSQPLWEVTLHFRDKDIELRELSRLTRVIVSQQRKIWTLAYHLTPKPVWAHDGGSASPDQTSWEQGLCLTLSTCNASKCLV